MMHTNNYQKTGLRHLFKHVKFLIILALCFSPDAAAACQFEIIPGNSFQLPLLIDVPETEMSGIDIFIQYDPAIYTLTDIRLSDTLLSENYNLRYFQKNNGTKIMIYGTSHTYTGSGEIVWITFHVAKEYSGHADIQLTSFFCNEQAISGGFQYHDSLCMSLNVNSDPLHSTLESFNYFVQEDHRVRIEWKTITEIEIVGFQLWRNTPVSNNDMNITSQMIPPQGSFFSGYTYSRLDEYIGPQQTYKLKIIFIDGSYEWHFPFHQSFQINQSDFNRDGKVDLKDLNFIMRYLSK